VDNITVRTIVPILLLIGIGFASKKFKILKPGDERVLSSYIYYFALPALLLVNIAETTFTTQTLTFMLAGILPVLVVLVLYLIIYAIFRFNKHVFYLVLLSTIFGSWGFYGVPFIMFAFPTSSAEHFAILALVSIAVVSFTIALTILELYKLGKTTLGKGLAFVARRLSRNPLILSIAAGFIIAFTGIHLPTPVSTPLHMLGGTTATVAIFLLGVFLHGRRYTHIVTALKLSLLRIVLLPLIAIAVVQLFNLSDPERSIIVLMHGMPVALSMIVLSERYDFFRETVATLILISSVGAVVYLNVWLLILGHQ
jgi:predicted permease